MNFKDIRKIAPAAALCITVAMTGACGSTVPSGNTETSETTEAAETESPETTETSESSESTESSETSEETEPSEDIYTPPFSDASEIMSLGHTDFFVPFQDPERSFCYVNEGFCVPVLSQVGGTCWAYSSVVTMQLQHLIDTGEYVQMDPLELVDLVYVPHLEEEEEGLHLLYPDEDYRYSLGGSPTSVIEAMMEVPVNGYYITGSDILVDQIDLSFDGVNGTAPNIADIDTIKAYLRDHGPLGVGVLAELNPGDFHMNRGYMTLYYYEAMTDHMVTIVGYDDDFPASLYIHDVASDGAWLIQNSWGEHSGNSGYFWLSYDAFIECPESFEISNDYTDAFSYAHLFTEQISSGDVTSVASVYDHEGVLGAVGTYTFTEGTTVTVEICDGEFGDVLASKTETFEWPGYHTIVLDEDINVENYTVVVRSDSQIAFEMRSEGDEVYTYTEEDGPSAGSWIVSYSLPGQSFIETGDGWLDVTSDEAQSRFADEDGIADPLIVLLFR